MRRIWEPCSFVGEKGVCTVCFPTLYIFVYPHLQIAVSVDALVSAREDKPAWVTEGPEHSQLAFDLLFGAALRLTVVYDVSYRDFGLVSLKLAYHAPRWPAEMISRLPTGPFQLSGTAEASHNVTQTGVFSLNLKLSLQSDGQPAETPFGRMASRAASSALITQVPSLPLNATLVLTSLSKPPLRFQVRQVTAC